MRYATQLNLLTWEALGFRYVASIFGVQLALVKAWARFTGAP
jgi:hypothetical protein